MYAIRSYYEQALHHLQRHGGVAYLPRHMVAPAIKAGELHLVEGAPLLTRPLYLAYRSGSEQEERIGQLLDHPFKLGSRNT